jgi:secondary thiamine-phosphate synthase enzyme
VPKNDWIAVTREFALSLEAEFGHADITGTLEEFVRETGLREGIAVVAISGSTGAVTTIEYEPGALADLRRALEAVAPVTGDYEHNARWGDGNGFSHVRSALLKTSVTFPVSGGSLVVGTWQQIVVINLDNRPRRRSITMSLVGL